MHTITSSLGVPGQQPINNNNDSSNIFYQSPAQILHEIWTLYPVVTAEELSYIASVITNTSNTSSSNNSNDSLLVPHPNSPASSVSSTFSTSSTLVGIGEYSAYHHHYGMLAAADQGAGPIVDIVAEAGHWDTATLVGSEYDEDLDAYLVAHWASEEPVDIDDWLTMSSDPEWGYTVATLAEPMEISQQDIQQQSQQQQQQQGPSPGYESMDLRGGGGSDFDDESGSESDYDGEIDGDTDSEHDNNDDDDDDDEGVKLGAQCSLVEKPLVLTAPFVTPRMAGQAPQSRLYPSDSYNPYLELTALPRQAGQSDSGAVAKPSDDGKGSGTDEADNIAAAKGLTVATQVSLAMSSMYSVNVLIPGHEGDHQQSQPRPGHASSPHPVTVELKSVCHKAEQFGQEEPTASASGIDLQEVELENFPAVSNDNSNRGGHVRHTFSTTSTLVERQQQKQERDVANSTATPVLSHGSNNKTAGKGRRTSGATAAGYIAATYPTRYHGTPSRPRDYRASTATTTTTASPSFASYHSSPSSSTAVDNGNNNRQTSTKRESLGRRISAITEFEADNTPEQLAIYDGQVTAALRHQARARSLLPTLDPGHPDVQDQDAWFGTTSETDDIPSSRHHRRTLLTKSNLAHLEAELAWHDAEQRSRERNPNDGLLATMESVALLRGVYREIRAVMARNQKVLGQGAVAVSLADTLDQREHREIRKALKQKEREENPGRGVRFLNKLQRFQDRLSGRGQGSGEGDGSGNT